MSTWTLTARWIIPVDGPPLEHGTVTIQGDHFLNPLPQGKRKADMDLGNAAILPGFVNAHTHLDLSGLRGKCPTCGDFTQWLRAVVQHRRSCTEDDIYLARLNGTSDSASAGTTLLGDIAGTMPTASEMWGGLGLRMTSYLELIGLPFDRAREVWRKVTALDEFPGGLAGGEARPGLSPHAPYSVHKRLFRWAAAHARQKRLPLATHLAESKEELELLEYRRGPFVECLSDLGVWYPPGLFESPEQIVRYCAGEFPVVLVHCNYLDPATPIPSNASIVYCPRTHAAFGHPPHPFREFLARGVRVALGTDSLASNPDLDVLAEARFVHRHYPDVPGPTILHMATLAGAEALGWADVTGSIREGKSADLVVLPLPDVDSAEPYSLILESNTRVRAVLFRGQWTVAGP